MPRKKLTRIKATEGGFVAKKYDPENGAFGDSLHAQGAGDKDKLSPRHFVFAAEYILDFNPTRAYKAAGFKGKNVASKAYLILNMPQVQAEIRLLLKRRQEERKLTSDKIIEELSKVALADIREIFDEQGNIINPKLMSDTLAASIASIELYQSGKAGTAAGGPAHFPAKVKNLRRWDKMKALELLGRYLGLDKVKYELTGPGGTALVPPVFNINFVPIAAEDKYRGTAIDPCPPIR